jgi:hypothetical protein
VKYLARLFTISAIALSVSLFVHTQGFCQEESLGVLAKGQYFTIYGPKDLNVGSLLNALDFNYVSRRSSGSDYGSAQALAETLDALYSQVSDTLDIHVYSFHGTIKFVANQSEVSSVFYGFFSQPFPERSFYIHERNTIYISAGDATLGMMGHEIAHAIISHYFVTPPPEKVQEVLAGYVEYHLRKATGTLR